MEERRHMLIKMKRKPMLTGAFTKDFIKQIVEIQKNRDKTVSPKGITGITVWGISDQTSWRSRL